MNTEMSSSEPAPAGAPSQPLREIPVDWEALEDAFENNAPEVHSYLHLATGDVLRVVDGVADPQMHTRINGDSNYLRIAPVSSREQYRWMERFIPMVEDHELRGRLATSIDGKGAFRRFKDVLMSHATERERWFGFRSERLRTFMEAWLSAHAIKPIARPHYSVVPPPPPSASVERTEDPNPVVVPAAAPVPDTRDRRAKTLDHLRKHLRDLGELLGPRDLESVIAFGEFLKARRAARAASVEALDHAHDEGPTSSERAGGSQSTEATSDVRPTGTGSTGVR